MNGSSGEIAMTVEVDTHGASSETRRRSGSRGKPRTTASRGKDSKKKGKREQEDQQGKDGRQEP